MQKQTVEFATVVKNGVVEKIGRSSVYVPKTNFKGGSIKWYEDKPKKPVIERSWADGQPTIRNIAVVLWKWYAIAEKVITINLYEV